MADSLRFFTGFSDGSFFINMKERFTEYYQFCEGYYEECWRESDSIFFAKAVSERFSSHPNKVEIKSGISYAEECYGLRELSFVNEVEQTIKGLLGEGKIIDYVKILVNKIDLLIGEIEIVKLEESLEETKDKIVSKLTLLVKRLRESYLGKTKNIDTIHKIQWLGKTNLLVTLIFDLWQGQEKGKNNPKTKPLIKATKKELEDFLINNFIDAKGKPLTSSTLSDYLNTSESKLKKRVNDPNFRIEIPEKL